ncbi:unnamed protein product [Protopolystoma xenopodis]|uniref:Dynein heavy chain AAA lid domain-containing protein n=1 Tax=Protopolystoma xenopodis TaxID=117903 RepID=A0A3S5C7P4_9PLAT|nr:unnamed protein product [Protopolystoma xenopodis]
MCRAPTERVRLYFLLAWFNGVLQERLRYVPLGWSKRYEFNESDLKVAFDTIDVWVDAVAMGRANLPPERVPWAALRTLLSQCIYGGKVDNQFDQRLIETFLAHLFTYSSFEHDFPLIANVDGISGHNIVVPDGSSIEDLLSWINALPDTQTPSWLGLPNNAEKVLLHHMGTLLSYFYFIPPLSWYLKKMLTEGLLKKKEFSSVLGQKVISDLLKMQAAQEDDDASLATTMSAQIGVSSRPSVSVDASSGLDARPIWMRQLQTTCEVWLSQIPVGLKPLRRTLENIRDPLYRCFEREVNTGLNLLNEVRRDLADAIQVS